MGERDAGGLTLEGLAHKLEALTEKLGGLERENAELRDEVSALRSSGTRREGPAETSSLVPRREGQRASGFEGPVSRRALLSKAGAAAVAAVAAGTLLYPRQAKAHDATTDIVADRVLAHYLEAKNHVGGTALWAETTSTSTLDHAVLAANHGPGSGIVSVSTGDAGRAIYAEAQGEGGTGVVGTLSSNGSETGYGVVGRGRGASFAGVRGINSSGTGVQGEGSTTAEVAGVRGLGKTGMWGSSAATGYSGVYGEHTGTAGYGVVGDGKGATGAGVVGRNPSGYGGQFEGGRAQLKLKPAASLGKPITGTHTKGEIYMDKAGSLFVCTAGDGTSVGTWKKVNMKLV